MAINSTNYIICENIETNEIQIFDNKKICANELNIALHTIHSYVNKNKLLLNKYILTIGEQHEKKITHEIIINKRMYNNLTKITKAVLCRNLKTRKINNTNLSFFANVILKDFLFNYEINNNNTI